MIDCRRWSLFVRAAGVALVTLAGVQAAQAAPIATLAFRDRVGTVSPTDSVDVWLTLTLDAQSAPLVTDAGGAVTSGLSAADYQGVGIETLTSAGLNVSFLCSGTFTAACINGPPYDFSFATGPGSMVFPKNLNLQPGDSLDFLFGTFTPDGGPVPAGTYRFYTAALFFNLSGLDAGGAPRNVRLDIAATCGNGDTTCAFERTVQEMTPVPEPATLSLLSFGIAGLAHRYRRRTR